ncbi:MAG: GAF domain-containing protein [Bacteroidaceae bacterium]|jgi:GAF domain-containing protein|nr:GAF domain-containing protein [Bacteroidaceae bacterium]MBR5884505.1 GAF domain-containing protein [Bacteroidaceae bacterium]
MSKSTAYEELLNEVKSFIQDENDKIACMANVAALIHERFGFWWTGFYRVIGEELVLGPFQGPVACTRIRKGRGVCGTSWNENRTVIVPNVHEFPGHIACSSLSNSEIVVPVFDECGNVTGVLDIDSRDFDTFDETDAEWLEKICRLIRI